MEKKYQPLKLLFTVLLFGGLWGIIEATLGTFLHLPMVKMAGMYVSNSVILVPIAFMLMGACYKRSGTFRSVFYMGVLAAGIKAISCAVFHMSFNPAYYILMEALCMGVALFVFRPKELLSFKGLGLFIFANTMYLTLSAFIRVNVTTDSMATITANIEKYVFMINAIAILYTFAFGSLLFGGVKLAQKYNWDFDNVKKIIYSPITASVVASAMVVVTFLVK